MKKVSEIINKLESLKAKHGDLPVITYNNKCDFFSGNIDDDETEVKFGEKDAWNSCDNKCVDCIVIC